ncbi:SRPBCC domain-containing protein [Actinophytocola sp.]|uniref:SRPBCC family protein n=1 Tax=Actinophytocola sp. TaxID=1872138 RepID=UPI002D6A7EEE|nr:SRPBCC domain-containing protein [Actinophytocola sp.]HYQ62856.1 SRPBCC domain-containing protein [Actinophytocola sp.]
MTRDITVDVELPHGPETVWRALTDPAALAEWLMPVRDFEPVVGQRFTVHAKPMPGWDGVVHCEVTAVDEPHTLAYTWRGSRMRATTTVTWTLSESAPGRTRLLLQHNGFPGLSGAVLAFMHRNGWRRMMTTRLAAHLAATGPMS